MTKDLVEKGYRWITVNGPYACVTEQELGKITSSRTDLAELHMVEEGRVYYLIPGTLVRVTRDDEANGMSVILLGELPSLCGPTRSFSAHIRSGMSTESSKHRTQPV